MFWCEPLIRGAFRSFEKSWKESPAADDTCEFCVSHGRITETAVGKDQWITHVFSSIKIIFQLFIFDKTDCSPSWYFKNLWFYDERFIAIWYVR